MPIQAPKMGVMRDICEKIVILSYPLAFDAPVRGFPSEYCHPVRCGKTKMVGLPNSEKTFEDMCNRLGTIPACDRQMDRRTDRHLATAYTRYAYASRSKKCPIQVKAMAYKTFVRPQLEYASSSWSPHNTGPPGEKEYSIMLLALH